MNNYNTWTLLCDGGYLNEIACIWYSDIGLILFGITWASLLIIVIAVSNVERVGNIFSLLRISEKKIKRYYRFLVKLDEFSNDRVSRFSIGPSGGSVFLFCGFIYVILCWWLIQDPNGSLTGDGSLQQLDYKDLATAINFLYLFAALGLSILVSNIVIMTHIIRGNFQTENLMMSSVNETDNIGQPIAD